jgi:thioredoxin-dependent peroxiredoxin
MWCCIFTLRIKQRVAQKRPVACGIIYRKTALNTVVLGVNVDNTESHKAFKEKENLNFILLSDTDGIVSRQYSGLNPAGMAKRVTFIIDKKGFIKRIFPKVDVNGHAQEILAVLNEMK